MFPCAAASRCSTLSTFQTSLRRVKCNIVTSAAAILASKGEVMVFTGAGVSAESGVPTYRDPGGIWESYDQKAVGHISGFCSNPLLCWRFEFELWKLLRSVDANPAHHSLAELERRGFVSGVITQNVDGLHQLAGSSVVHELHGNEMRGICLNKKCRKTYTSVEIFQMLRWVDPSLNIIEANVPEPPNKKSKQKLTPLSDASSSSDDGSPQSDDDTASDSDASSSGDASCLSTTPSSSSSDSDSASRDYQAIMEKSERRAAREAAPKCPTCSGVLKPDAIYFGEELDRHVRRRCIDLSKASKLCIVVGSSCIVAPANKLPLMVRANGGHIIEVNPKPSLMTRHAYIHHDYAAGEVLPLVLISVSALAAAEAAAYCVAALAAACPELCTRPKIKKVVRKVVRRKLVLKKKSASSK